MELIKLLILYQICNFFFFFLHCTCIIIILCYQKLITLGDLRRVDGCDCFFSQVCLNAYSFGQWSVENHFVLRWFLLISAAKSLQLCLTRCDLLNCTPPGSPVPGLLQARILEWVAISFSNAWKWKVKVKSLSHVLLLVTPWTAAYQAPPSMEFSRQEYWSGVPLPSPCLSLQLSKYVSLTSDNFW